MRISNIKNQIDHGLGVLAGILYDKPLRSLFLLNLLTVFLGVNLIKVEYDLSSETFLPKEDVVIKEYTDFIDTFGRDDYLVVAVKADNVFDVKFLSRLENLHADLEENVSYLDSIQSLINAKKMRGNEEQLYSEPYYKALPKNQDELLSLKDEITKDRKNFNLLVSESLEYAIILLKAQPSLNRVSEEDVFNELDSKDESLSSEDDREYTSKKNAVFNSSIVNILDKHRADQFEISYAGQPRTAYEYFKSVTTYMPLFAIATSISIAIALLLLFRAHWGLMIPSHVVGMAVISTLGLMSLLGFKLTLVTQILPSFLLAIGIADSIHVLNHFKTNYAISKDKRASIVKAMNQTGTALIITTLTTMCGLLSFSSSNSPAIKQLGAFTAIGTAFALLYTVIFIPAAISKMKIKAADASSLKESNSYFTPVLEFISGLSATYPKTILSVFSLILVFFIYGTTFLRFSHDTLSWFPKDSDLVVTSDTLGKEIPSGISIEIVIDSQKKNGVFEPEFQRKLQNFTADLSEVTKDTNIRIGQIHSISYILEDLNTALNGGRQMSYKVPSSREQIAQEFLLLENADSEKLFSYIDSSYRKTRLSVLLSWESLNTNYKIVKRVKKLSRQYFPKKSQASVTGITTVLTQTLNIAMETMMTSYLWAGISITLIMCLLFWSVRLGLLSMIPNFFPIICGLGYMGYAGIPLDLTTLLVANICLGLVVDDTTHFFHTFEKFYKEDEDVDKAVNKTIVSTGKALTFTSLTLICGFMVLTISNMSNLVHFGLVTSLVIAIALVADLILSPVLLSMAYRKKS